MKSGKGLCLVGTDAMAWMPLTTFISLLCFLAQPASGIREYYMDQFSDCERTINVDDSGVKIHARSMTAPSNPPLSCIIYLRSSYTRNDGTNKLQIVVDYLNIRDCMIKLDLFNGRKSVGEYLKAMSCQQPPVGVIYSKMNEVTVKLSRPQTLFNTEYGFTLTIKPYKDRSVMGSDESNDKLSIGAIIGIVIGCLVVIAVLVLLCWFCCSGRISGTFYGKSQKEAPGLANKGMMEEKFKAPALVLNDPAVWSTNGGRTSDRFQPRYFQRGVPRNEMRVGGEGGGQGGYYNRNKDRLEYEWRLGEGRQYYGNVQRPPRPEDTEPGHNYEPYNEDSRRVANDRRPSPRSSPKQQQKNPSPQQLKKETLIDDVFDSDSTAQTSDYDDTTLQKRPISDDEKPSPKSKRKSQPIPEEEEHIDKSPQLERYKSMDLQSQPDTDTITSPVHVNAGVRASVEDDLGGSPVGSLCKTRGHKSPQAHRKGGRREPEGTVMPPEAFEPIFDADPISGIHYPNNQYPPGYGQVAPQFPGGFMPYGLIPSGAFATPGVPGSQTYAYAYQTVPQGGAGGPSTQGAWVMHNTPTADGNQRRTAFAVEETASPDKSGGRKRNDKSDSFGRTPYRDSGSTSRRAGGRGPDKLRMGYAPDLSVVTRDAAPPDPGQGHRSVALKSGTDPNTGIHTVQGVWTDTVADATDPEPGVENPQITRKTITRVTTKSGYGEIPPENDPLIALEAEPAFLNPSSRPSQTSTPSIMPPTNAANTPNIPNIDYYTGTGSTLPPPERSSTPTSTPRTVKLGHNGVIRDRIPLDDSTV